MKTLLVVVLVALGSAAHATEAQFCQGFAVGFVKGWNGLNPHPESPPIPACEIGILENSDDSTLSSFEQGEEKGRQRGIKAYKDDLGSGSPTDIARKKAAIEAAKAQELARQQAVVEEEKQRAAAAVKEKEDAVARDKADEQEVMQHAVDLVACLKHVIATMEKVPEDAGRFRQTMIDSIQSHEPEREGMACPDVQVIDVVGHALCVLDPPPEVREALKAHAARRGVVLNCTTPASGSVAATAPTSVGAHSPSSEPRPSPSLEGRPQPPVTAPATAAARPSFDCSKAGTQVEKLICANPQLASADADLAILYKKAVAASRDSVLPAQRAFVAKRNLCTTAECVAEAYRSRYEELAAMGY
jgi:uncharacterized protein YecT (DUF1311 family)